MNIVKGIRMKRRSFLKSTMGTAATLTVSGLVPTACISVTDHDASGRKVSGPGRPAAVPDTLDLVDMAHRGLNSRPAWLTRSTTTRFISGAVLTPPNRI